MCWIRCHILFTCSSVGGHLGCFHFLASMNNPVNTHLQTNYGFKWEQLPYEVVVRIKWEEACKAPNRVLSTQKVQSKWWHHMMRLVTMVMVTPLGAGGAGGWWPFVLLHGSTHLQLFFICTFFFPSQLISALCASSFMDCLVPSSLRTGPSSLFSLGISVTKPWEWVWWWTGDYCWEKSIRIFFWISEMLIWVTKPNVRFPATIKF